MVLEEGSKITWVRWFDVCKPKRFSGLGVHDLRLVNLVMLGKWRRQSILGDSGLWRDIFSARYGVILTTPVLGGRAVYFRAASRWKMMSLLGGKREDPSV